MQSRLDKKHAAIQAVCGLIAKHQPAARVNNMQQLAKQYFDESMFQTLLQLNSAALYGSIISLWDHIHQRSNGACNIEIYNPNHAEYLWQSSYTVIDIVCDDIPFLISSITNALTQLEYKIHLNTHPVMAIERHPEGHIKQIHTFDDRNQHDLESVMRFEIDHESNSDKMQAIATTLRGVIRDVDLVVKDWHPMRSQLLKVINYASDQQLPISNDEKDECLAFLRWLVNNHFTFIGYRAYNLVENRTNGLYQLNAIKESGLGSLQDQHCSPASLAPIKLNAYQSELACQQQLLVLTKSSKRSTVHRLVNMDYLGIKRFNAAGQVVGEDRFYGLYSSTAYTTNINQVPLLRHKVEALIERMKVLPNSHKSKALQHVFNNFPRDEMLQANVEELLPMIQGILETQERHQLRLFVHIDKYGRFTTVLAYIPRERFNTQLRMRIQHILLR